ncbi:peptidoglycan-binding domain-containing protein [Dactylosporangium sp. NPDC000244]|uniref:peptidoglycan-binding domain-containing protein n=1 Tax=Dactylosporangium sp. NPDC000244 TaxID=3154365 RepID=UPI003333E9B5
MTQVAHRSLVRRPKRAAALLVTAVAVATAVLVGTAAPAGAASRSATPAYSPTNCSTTKYYNSWVGASETVPNHVLSQGDYGDYCVANLQWGIDNMYGSAADQDPIAIDGNFGAQTYAWVRRFQSDYKSCSGNSVDGIAGNKTNSCMQYLEGVF